MGRAIARAEDRSLRIIEIAGVCGLKTIAEGIEDGATFDLLRELGADYA